MMLGGFFGVAFGLYLMAVGRLLLQLEHTRTRLQADGGCIATE